MSPVTRFPFFAFALVLATAVIARPAQESFIDPAFSQVRFEQWLSESHPSHMRWTVRIADPELSTHQRLAAALTVQVDGVELAKLRGKGQLLVLVQLADEKGHVWQNHQELDLGHIDENIRNTNMQFSQRFFVLPGDYRVSVALYADATGDHSIVERRLHVPPLKNDPLPLAWSALPAVEFIPPSMPPDSWFLPSITGTLQLTAATRERVHVDLLVNLTPAEQFAGSTHMQNRIFEALLPATKVLSQIEWGNADFGLGLLDLSRLRTVYQQDDTRALDWSKAGVSLGEENPGIIDARALEQRNHCAQFFIDAVRRRLRVARSRRPAVTPVLIVLSSAIQFLTSQELRPIAFETTPPAKVFYIRYQPPPDLFFGPPQAGTRRPRPVYRAGYVAVDQLEPLLKPLDPRLFDVTTQQQFRKALAAILTEISKL